MLPSDEITPGQWYKTSGGKVFVAILGALGVMALIFIPLVGYYVWQIRSGNAPDIEKKFSSKRFTQSTEVSKDTNTSPIVDIRRFVRPNNPTLGSSSAPITVLAFIDFECPFSQEGYQIFQNIMKKYAPVMQVVFKQFPIVDIHPKSNGAANAAACAHAQKKFWPYYDRLFQTKALDQTSLAESARAIPGLDRGAWTTCTQQSTYQQAIDTDRADGVELGVRGTPTYFVNGTKIEGVVDEAVWNKVLLEEIQQKSPVST